MGKLQVVVATLALVGVVQTVPMIAEAGGAVERLWRGGEGNWSDPDKWNPSGVPGSAADDIAAIPASDACVLHVGSDTVLSRLNANGMATGGSLTFDVESGASLSAGSMRLKAACAVECLVAGGGAFALTDGPFGVGSNGAQPVHFTVSGKDTVFSLPKPSNAGLYVGAIADKLQSVDNVFRVTDGAKAIVSNAVSVGQGYDIDNGLYPRNSGGRLLVDAGGYFYGGKSLIIGRDQPPAGNRREAAVCAVTNATLDAVQISLGGGYYTLFTGSNALVRAESILLPDNTEASRYQSTSFADSTFAVGTVFRMLAAGRYNTNEFLRCHMSAAEWTFGTGKSWESDAFLTGCDLTGNSYQFGFAGTSNTVTRFTASTIVATNHVYVGYEAGSQDARVEMDGGSLSCKTVMIGKSGSVRCGVRVCGNPVLNVSEWIVGDALGSAVTRAQGPWAEFVDTTNTLPKLLIGVASENARVLVSNATVTMRSDADHFVVGRDAGAAGNVLRVARGGICAYESNAKDIYVGQFAGANGNRLELDGGTFRYNRRYMAVGLHGSSNVWSMANGARLDASDAQLWFGANPEAKGNRLVMCGESTATVRKFVLQNDAVAEFVGAGNVLTVGNEGVTVADGTSFVFRPSSESATKPLVTVNRQLAYGPKCRLVVDVANLEPGTYRLMSCADGVPTVDGVPVTFENLSQGRCARIRRSADGKELQLIVPSGLMIMIR